MIPKKIHIFIVPLLLAAFFVQAAIAWRDKSATFDEPTHLGVGWLYLKTRDFYLNVEHPPLIKQWAALPLLVLPLGEPDRYVAWKEGEQTAFAHYFFYEGNDFARMFFSARLFMIALATLLGLWVYLWSRQLWGGDGALLSLVLFAFSPNLIAHSAIVGTDYALASFGLLSFWLWARMLCRPTIARSFLAGFGVGLMLLSKFAAIAYAPIWFGWWLLAMVSRGKWPAELMRERTQDEHPSSNEFFSAPWSRPSLIFWAGRFALIAAIAALIICADYGFQFDALGAGLSRFVGHLERGHPAYLHGEVSVHGWWNYFPVAWFIKTPLPEIILIAWAWVMWIRQRLGYGPWALLAAPWFYVLALSMAGGVCIGYRHILPMVPLGLVMAGGAIQSLNLPAIKAQRKKLTATLMALLLIWQIWGAIAISPNPMTFFNELIGGPSKGSRWLSDSNIDWGQDLSTLSRWMKKTNTPWVYLSYFGTASPTSYGITYGRLPGYNSLRDSVFSMNRDSPQTGIYAISVTNLTGQYLDDPNTFRWFREREPDERLGNSIFIYNVP